MDTLGTLTILICAFITVLCLLLYLSNKRQLARIKEDFNTNHDRLRADCAGVLNELKVQMQEHRRESRDDYQRGQKDCRDEIAKQLTAGREELANTIRAFQHSFDKNVELLSEVQRERLSQLEKMQNERLQQLDRTQGEMIRKTDEKLERIRTTVEEKLDRTLSERLGKSFETVGKQLSQVQQGLGEMKNLAQDVGGLKKVLSNVKMRGGLGEVQLHMLLENILAPDQFQMNVCTRRGSREVVEFAVKLPGNTDAVPHIWLPIDAKFPKDVYQKLQEAYDLADAASVEAAQKELDHAIKTNARDICSKYVDPPYTTNFAIMFLPFEGIYAEVVRKADLLEYLQKTYNVIVTGPTTLAAILNSLQMGFKTLAIQRRSSEVWETLGAVKTEFEKFGGILEKAKNKIQGGLTDMDTLVGTRTRAIQRTLKAVEVLDSAQTERLPEGEGNDTGKINPARPR